MKSMQLRAVAMTAAENLVKLIEENADEILKDIQAVAEEAQAQEADKIVFTLNHTIKLNLTAKAMIESITWGVRKKLEAAFAMPDPEQPELPIHQ
jgi:ABC-type branched-subunit amino acid transport system ATPase component